MKQKDSTTWQLDSIDVRAVSAPIEIRTHEDGHVPPGVQPLQVALLRKALPRPPHPPRTGSPTQKVTFRPSKSYFLPSEK